MTDYAGYNVELDKVSDCPEVHGGTPSVNFSIPILKKDPDYDVPVDTAYLGAGATEHIQIFDSTTEIFKALNRPGKVFLLTDQLGMNCTPACNTKHVAEIGFDLDRIFTDCGENPTGLAIYSVAKQAGVEEIKLPIQITGNWTPQIKTGHILISPAKGSPGIKLSAYTYKCSSPCNPTGAAGVSGITSDSVHVLNYDNLKTLYCVNTMSPVGYYDQAGVYIPMPTVIQSDGNIESAMALSGPEPSCIAAPGSYFVRFVGRGQQALSAICSAIEFEYRRNDGRRGRFVASTKPIPGAILCEINQSETVVLDTCMGVPVDHCDRQHSKWAYIYTNLPFYSPSTGPRASGSSEVACSGTASLAGTSFNDTAGINMGEIVAVIPAADEFPFNESAGFSVSATHNGVTVSASGTITLSHTCGSPYAYVTLSGSFNSGTLAFADVANPPDSCTGTIQPAYQNADGHTGEWQPVLSLTLPVSPRKIQIEARMSANAFGYKFSFFYLTAAHVDGFVQTRIVYKD